MILVVGLGNPGIEYSSTKHNAGFVAVQRLADETGVEITKKSCKSLIFSGKIFGKNVVIAKPQTFMNLSGQAVVELANFYKPDKILIVYDDVDLPFGTIRFRQNGSAGTHNGMRSVIGLSGRTDIARIRIGIKPDEEIYNLADYVLGKIEKDYRERFDSSINDAYLKMKEFIEKDGNI